VPKRKVYVSVGGGEGCFVEMTLETYKGALDSVCISMTAQKAYLQVPEQVAVDIYNELGYWLRAIGRIS